MLEYTDTVDAMARRLLPALALSLDLPEDSFDDAFAESQFSFRMSHYPAAERGAGRYGIAPHTDANFMTFLAQSGVPGLQIRSPAGNWRDVPDDYRGHAALIGRCPNLLAISTGGAGYDTIHVDDCTAAGVLAVNQAGMNAEAVAEHAVGMIDQQLVAQAQVDVAGTGEVQVGKAVALLELGQDVLGDGAWGTLGHPRGREATVALELPELLELGRFDLAEPGIQTEGLEGLRGTGHGVQSRYAYSRAAQVCEQ